MTNIGIEAFDECFHVTIVGQPGSYAESYARSNGLKFAAK